MSHLPPHAPGIDWNAVSAVATLVATLTAIVLAFLANISERRRHQSAAVAALGLALKTAEDAVSFFEGAEKKKTTTSDHQAKLIIGGARIMDDLQGCRDAVATLRSELARYTPAPPK
jgi:hypothetical protein